MKLLALTLFTILAGGVTPPSKCRCQPVPDDAEPLGGNQIVQAIEEEPAKRIRGKVVYFANGKPAEDVIVEVFKYPEPDSKLEPYKVPGERARVAACLTNKTGGFCFDGLPPGKYLLRAGTRTRNREYFNHYHLTVTLNPKAKKSSNKELEMNLSLAN